MKKMLMVLFLALFCIGGTAYSNEIEILPTSYSFDKYPGGRGSDYPDETGNQLIDGITGIAPWTADLGNGRAYEWVGWGHHNNPVNIDFDFDSPTRIDKIVVGTVQDHIGDVVVPDIDIFYSSDATSWTSAASLVNRESSLNDNTRFDFIFDELEIDAQYVRVHLSFNYDGPWIFSDEIDFFQTSPVPEPATLLLLGLGLIGLAGIGRKRRH